MIHAEQPIMDVERRIDVDADLTPIVEEYVFPESPNQVQREEVSETLVAEPVADALEPEVVETVADVLEPKVVETVADALEPILTNAAPINRHRKPWSVSEIARLYREYQINRYTVDEIAEMHGRTYFAIVGKLKSENILYNVSDEEDEYLEHDESDDDECEEGSGCQIQLPSAFLMLARAYCYAVEFVVDVAFAGVRCVYRTFVPRVTEGRHKRKIR
jgi:hypothetical protein